MRVCYSSLNCHLQLISCILVTFRHCKIAKKINVALQERLDSEIIWKLHFLWLPEPKIEFETCYDYVRQYGNWKSSEFKNPASSSLPYNNNSRGFFSVYPLIKHKVVC